MRNLWFVILFLVAGLALLYQAPGDPLERLADLGIALIAASLVIATQLERREARIIRWASPILLALFIIFMLCLKFFWQ